ncbi:Fc.00g074420.m01.CDS01 [Cosmosporella sp. VM-42]
MAPIRFPADAADPSPLAQPLKFEFSGQVAKNRFMKGAMSERLATWDPTSLDGSGVPTKELINVYRRFGEGGYGIILTGAIHLSHDQLEATGNTIIPRNAPFSGQRFEAFKKLATVSKAHGSLVIAQLNHPGRQVSSLLVKTPISASDVQLEGLVLGETFNKPRPMEEKDFEEVIGMFAHAAEFCYEAGFDGIQLHGAHGYLIAQFLAPSTNLRTDKYGGSLPNRARLIFEIADAMRARVPGKSFSIGIKINSVEFQKGGFSTEDCKKLCVELEKYEFDMVELSGGTYEVLAFDHKRESTKKREAYFLEFATMILPELKKTKAYVTGGLRTLGAMVKALDTVHGIGLGRPACNEFDLPQKLLDGKVNSAIQGLLDEQNFGLTNVAGGSQIRLVGKDKEPLDFSNEKHSDAFMASMQKWGERLAHNEDLMAVGYVDVEGVTLNSYGTAY